MTMPYFKHSFSVVALSFLLMSCSDTPSDPVTVSKEGWLTYSVDQYANFSAPDPKVEVTYRNFAGELVVDTVQVPWEKTLEYSYSTTPDSLRDFKANFIVQYRGDYAVFLIARIRAEQTANESRLGKAFTINLNSILKLPGW